MTSNRLLFFFLVLLACSEDSAGTGATSSTSTSSSTSSTSTSTSSTTGAGGSGGGGGPVVGEICAAFGEAFANCRENCTFEDPARAALALGAACQSSLDTLTGMEKDQVNACVDCATQASGPSCDVPFDFDGTPECDALCASMDPMSGVDQPAKFFSSMAPNLSGAVTCTNGRNPLHLGNCTASGQIDPPTCDPVCCMGFACADGNPSNADVAAHCTGNGPVDCTCTVGANTGSTFQFASCDELWLDPYMVGYDVSPLWDLCNL